MSELQDSQKVRLLMKTIRDLRAAMEESGIDSSACLLGENVHRPINKKEAAWIFRNYRLGRL